MKRILVSMMTIALVSALIGGGIYAAFSDTEEGHVIFRAGTLDLIADGSSEGFEFEAGGPAGMAPGEEGTVPFELKNIGSIAGDLDVAFGAVTDLGVRGTLGTAEADGSTTMLKDSSLGQGLGYWVGYYVVLYEEAGDDGEARLVTAFDDGELTVDPAWSGLPDGKKYALQTEHEVTGDGDLADYLEVAFLIKSEGSVVAWLGFTANDPGQAEVVNTEGESVRHPLSAYAGKSWSDVYDNLGAHEIIEFCASWKFGGNAYDALTDEAKNELQGAGIKIAITLTLNQIAPAD